MIEDIVKHVDNLNSMMEIQTKLRDALELEAQRSNERINGMLTLLERVVNTREKLRKMPSLDKLAREGSEELSKKVNVLDTDPLGMAEEDPDLKLEV